MNLTGLLLPSTEPFTTEGRHWLGGLIAIKALLPQPLDSGPHKLACLQSLHGLLIYFPSLPAQLNNLLAE